jgi:hypothetical protein
VSSGLDEHIKKTSQWLGSAATGGFGTEHDPPAAPSVSQSSLLVKERPRFWCHCCRSGCAG